MSPGTSDPTPNTPREVYQQTVGIADPVRREQQLDALCGQNQQLRSKVLKLLTAKESAKNGLLARAVGEFGGNVTRADESIGAHQSSGVLPDSIATALESDTRFVDPSARPGQRIGPYLLLEQLGQGGMGTVFLARQTEPVVRDVAIKVIRSDVTSPGIIRRFEAERQILAMMSHPNIAQVFDAGTTTDGYPYFVMELVRGIPITKYCEQYSIDLEDRLLLFIDLCRAIEHAHQKGAVHRDLKPANVLVSSQDSKPIVKVIDFGVAKALSPDLNADTPVTHFSQLVGTPLYMAPEQMRMRSESIDIRSDVYSLGVLLFELLTGCPPYKRDHLAKLGIHGFLALLESQPPPTPSQQTKHVGRQRRRELDWITIKAMNPVPLDRYQTAEALADDLQRFLSNEAILAGPPSKLYAARKWWRRNTSVATIFSLILLVFVIASQKSLWQIQPTKSTQKQDIEKERLAREWQSTARLQQAVTAFSNNDLASLRRTLKNDSNDIPSVDPENSSDAERCFLENFLLRTSSPQPDAVFSQSTRLGPMDFSSSASRIVAAGDDGVVWLYALGEDGAIAPVTTLGSHPDRVESVAISPDGTKAVTGSFSGQVWFWDLEQLQLQKQVPVFDAGIQSLTFSPDGEYVTAGARYAVAWIGDKNGNEVFRITNNHRHESILFAQDSRSLFLPTRQGIDEYEVPSGKKLRSISATPFQQVRTLCLGGLKNQWLIAGESYNEALVVIDIDTGGRMGTININGRYPQKLETFSDGKWLSVLYPDRRIEFIRLSIDQQGTVAGRSHLCFSTTSSPQPVPENAPLSLIWLDSKDRMLVAGGGHKANVWSWNHLMPLKVLIPPYSLIAAFPRDDNQLLYFQKYYQPKRQRPIPVSLYDRSTKPLGDPITFEIHCTSQRLQSGLVAVCGLNMIHILNCNTGITTAKLTPPFDLATGVTLSSSGNAMAVTNDERMVVWHTKDNWRTYNVVGDFPTQSNYNIKLTTDGETIICKHFGRLCELSARTGKLQRSYGEKSEFLSSICLSSNEDLLAVSLRADLEIWDRQTGELTHTFSGVSEVMATYFTPDDKTLLVGNRDGSIRAWQLSTSQSLGTLFRHTSANRTERLQFFPNSTQILAWAVSVDGLQPVVLGQPNHPAPKRIPAPTEIVKKP